MLQSIIFAGLVGGVLSQSVPEQALVVDPLSILVLDNVPPPSVSNFTNVSEAHATMVHTRAKSKTDFPPTRRFRGGSYCSAISRL